MKEREARQNPKVSAETNAPASASSVSSPVIEPVSSIIFRSENVIIGRFRLDTEHPEFKTIGSIAGPTIVFPRTAVSIQHEGCDALTIDQNCISLYNAGQRYERQACFEQGDQCEWFEFSPKFIDSFTPEATSPISPFSEARIEGALGLYLRQRELVKKLEAQSVPIEKVEAEMMALFQLSQNASRVVRSNEKFGKVEEARVYLARNYTQNDSIGDIAEAVGISEFHLCRIFKHLTGKTIHQYRSELRLRASLSLVETVPNLTRIAMDLGYSSHSHFTTSFCKSFGQSPRQFRTKLNK